MSECTCTLILVMVAIHCMYMTVTIMCVLYIFFQDIVRYCVGCYSRTCGQSRSKWAGQDWTPLFQVTQEVALNMTLQQLIDGECARDVCMLLRRRVGGEGEREREREREKSTKILISSI